ncbi:protein phosphatase 2C domain-containing protein [Cellulomonas hominis]|uniref:PP2C family protein-serine/threonine phosphatase n=1 Tax=Cellulomonas hominis TaxID=156981 RepID=UPI001C126333|nr:protein phosphatase 2C domain-containing protein [Cellulomonas hominis]MBU5422862.1 protein phosphatase 2C domain-containing protein [Cellulomonas hominis]
MPLSLVTALRSVTGAHRAQNQDAAGSATGYAFVADGVGGHAGGDVASWTVAHRLMAALSAAEPRRWTDEDLRSALAVANADLAMRVRREPELAGMATTFTGVFCGEDTMRVLHIGDSRAYLLRDGVGRRVTRDDSLVQLLVDGGVLSAADAAQDPRRNVILHCLAGDTADATHATLLEVDAAAGDRWLMATDGLTDYVPEEKVLALLRAASSPEEAAADLVEAALDADAWDNVSVAVAEVVVGDAGEAEPSRVAGSAADEALGVVLA